MKLHLLAVTTLVFGAHAFAQCDRWSDEFAFPGPNIAPSDIAIFDDGGGPLPYVSGWLPSPVRGVVQRCVAGNWETVLEIPILNPNFRLGGMTTGDIGAGNCLFVAHPIDNTSAEVWQWDQLTLTWVALPTLTGFGIAQLRVLDDGSGSKLYAVQSGNTSSKVWRWDGVSWSTLGTGLPSFMTSIQVFDSGTGPKLYAGRDTTSIVIIPPAPTLLTWDGSAWIGVDADTAPVLGLETYDDGNGLQLYVSQNAATRLTRFDGTVRTPVSDPVVNGIGLVLDMTKVDFGTGEQLFVTSNSTAASRGAFLHGTTWTAVPDFSGAALAAGDTSGAPSARLWLAAGVSRVDGIGCLGIATYDGATWSTLGRGLGGAVSAFEVADLGAGEQLFAVGTFQGAGYATGLNRVTRWDGTNWQSLGAPVNSNDVYAIESYDLGAGTHLFVGGDFLHVNGGAGAGVAEFDGANWTSPAGGIDGDVRALHGCDVGAGPRLYAAGSFVPPSAPATRVAQWDGVGAWTQVGGSVDATVFALTSYDDGSGLALYAGGAFNNAEGSPARHVARWNGSTWSAVGAGLLGGDVHCFCAFTSGGTTQLYAGGSFTGRIARWNGTTWSLLPGGGPNGTVTSLGVHDDGRGPALYAGGLFSAVGSLTTYDIARFDGTSWEAVDGGLDNLVAALASVDDDGDGDRELFAGGSFSRTATTSSAFVARLEGCPHYTSFCSGDGSLADHTTPCPCANDGAAGHGCASASNSDGALLTASGSTQLDDVVLTASGTATTAYGIYLQHDATGDRVFHDGVLCAGGHLLRLRVRSAVGGVSSFPDATDTETLSQRGAVAPGSGAVRYYSLFYRAPAATFCPPATANVTNGVRVIW